LLVDYFYGTRYIIVFLNITSALGKYTDGEIIENLCYLLNVNVRCWRQRHETSAECELTTKMPVAVAVWHSRVGLPETAISPSSFASEISGTRSVELRFRRRVCSANTTATRSIFHRNNARNENQRQQS